MPASEAIADVIQGSLLPGEGVVTLDCTEVALVAGMHPQRVGRWARAAAEELTRRGLETSYAGRLFIINGSGTC